MRTGGISSAFKWWLDASLSFFYPEICQICGTSRAGPADGFVCGQCWENVHFIRAPFCERCGLPFEGEITVSFECRNCGEMDLQFSKARSAVAARGMVLEIIHRYKYQRALWFEPFLADLLIRQAVPVLQREKWEMIVPVPLHPAKHNQREFNQAERLGRRLAARTGLVLQTDALQRRTDTRSQTRLSRQERAANMRSAFVVSDPASVRGRRIVLVDDVFTTGATTSACARVLKSAGAREICVWTVARGL